MFVPLRNDPGIRQVYIAVFIVISKLSLTCLPHRTPHIPIATAPPQILGPGWAGRTTHRLQRRGTVLPALVALRRSWCQKDYSSRGRNRPQTTTGRRLESSGFAPRPKKKALLVSARRCTVSRLAKGGLAYCSRYLRVGFCRQDRENGVCVCVCVSYVTSGRGNRLTD